MIDLERASNLKLLGRGRVGRRPAASLLLTTRDPRVSPSQAGTAASEP